MKRRIGTVAIGLAALAALIAVPAAMAAYASPKLTITQTATGTIVKASLDPNDDPTAAVLIVAPNGTQLTTSQAPGTVLGPVKAIVKALDLAGADLPLEGQLIVAAPGQIPAATQAACIGPGVVPLATWVMVLTAAGQTLQVPTYLVKTGGALAQIGPAVIAICLPPPDVPVGTPGRATFGAKVYSAELAINGVFSAVTSGAWVSAWTPYTPGAGKPNPAGTVAAPAAIAPGAVKIAARSIGSKLKGAAVSGQVTQAGQPRAGATVTLFGGANPAKLKRVGRKQVTGTGSFAFVLKSGTFFRVNVVAAPGPAPSACTALAAALAPIPCVNPTTNGFAVQSKAIKKKR